MRWVTVRQLPKTGDTRRRLRFAWLPTRVEHLTFWLEFYGVEEELVGPQFDGLSLTPPQWIERQRYVPVYYY